MADVVPFKGAVQSARKAQWLDHMAQGYDSFLENYGSEPDAFVFVFIGPGSIKSGWDIEDPFKQTRWNSMVLLLAAEHLSREASAGNDG
jgi:hypothetical protein